MGQSDIEQKTGLSSYITKSFIEVINGTCNPDVLNVIENDSRSKSSEVMKALNWRWKVLLAQKFILTEDKWPVRLVIELINETCDPADLNRIERGQHASNPQVYTALNLRWRALKELGYISDEDQVPNRLRRKKAN